MGKFYITTPIYYVNANPHIGHAYTQIAVDTIARYHKMHGDDVFFLTGTDEHGEKIEEACVEAGFGKGREKDFIDTIVVNFKKAWEALDVQYDRFIRTTEEEHEKVVQEFLLKIKDGGDIYQGEYDGWFCTPCETFWTQTQAENGTCPGCGRPVERLKEKNYFFRLSKYQKWLIDYINENPEFIMPEFRRNEVMGFLREDLTDLCISRPKERMAWGVELPFDKDYVVYVWFDALINYLSGCEYLKDKKTFTKYWPADFHIIAKDILRHHAVYWPIMLKSAGLPLPRTIFAHGWWKMGQDKMSKSKGNIVDPFEMIERFGVDPFRYFLIKTINFGQDGIFDVDSVATLYNSDLANDLGNLLNRTLTMVEKYFDGVSPMAPAELSDKEQQKRSHDIKGPLCRLLPDIDRYMLSPGLLLKESLEAVMSVVGKANKYIEASAPWKHSKEGNIDAIKVIIADLLEVLRKTAIGILPFMPSTARNMWEQLGLKGDIEKEVSKEEFREDMSLIPDWRKFPAGTKVTKGAPLFPRIQ